MGDGNASSVGKGALPVSASAPSEESLVTGSVIKIRLALNGVLYSLPFAAAVTPHLAS